MRVSIAFLTLLSKYTHIPMDMETDIDDVIICGSCVEYFYHKKSDIDLKIVLRGERYYKKMHPEILTEICKIIISFFSNRYNPNVAGMNIDMDIAIKSFEIPNYPRYSILKQEWLHPPRRLPKDEIKYLQHRATLYHKALMNQINRVMKDKTLHGNIMPLYNYMKERRTASWKEKRMNLSPYSLAYSRLNRDRHHIKTKMLKLNLDITRRMMLDISQNPA